MKDGSDLFALFGREEDETEVTMHESITIDSLDEETARWIENGAKKRKTNKETVALHLIRRGIKCEHEHAALKAYDDLDFLAGTWSEEKTTELMNVITDFDQVDEKLRQ